MDPVFAINIILRHQIIFFFKTNRKLQTFLRYPNYEGYQLHIRRLVYHGLLSKFKYAFVMPIIRSWLCVRCGSFSQLLAYPISLADERKSVRRALTLATTFVLMDLDTYQQLHNTFGFNFGDDKYSIKNNYIYIIF